MDDYGISGMLRGFQQVGSVLSALDLGSQAMLCVLLLIGVYGAVLTAVERIRDRDSHHD